MYNDTEKKYQYRSLASGSDAGYIQLAYIGSWIWL